MSITDTNILQLSNSKTFLLAGQHNVALLKPIFGRGTTLRLWAEKGNVCWEDEKDNTFGTLSFRQAGERVLALSDMVKNSKDREFYDDEIRALQNFVCQMEQIIREAKQQRERELTQTSPRRKTVLQPVQIGNWEFAPRGGVV